jgi:hypothetical protein
MPENTPLSLGSFVQNNQTGVSGATQYLPPNVTVGNATGSVDTVDAKYYSPGVTVGIDGAEKA